MGACQGAGTPQTDAVPLTAGQTIGTYRIVEQLGEGGLATVYKSFQPALERMVALKALPHFFAGKADFRDLPVPGR